MQLRKAAAIGWLRFAAAVDSRGYMSRVLRLTLLAPDIVEAILDGRQPEEMRLTDLLEGFSGVWQKQSRQP